MKPIPYTTVSCFMTADGALYRDIYKAQEAGERIVADKLLALLGKLVQASKSSLSLSKRATQIEVVSLLMDNSAVFIEALKGLDIDPEAEE